jgi:DNA-binding transcriptional MerR regulator
VGRTAANRAADGLLSIGEVLAALRPEFTDVTISKIRFLEAEGLVEPRRAPSGYRKFTHADIDRLRFVLAAQRDHYLPLRVIKEHLDAVDAGREPPAATRGRLGPTRVPHDTQSQDNTELILTRAQLLEAAEIDQALLEQLETYGLVAPRRGRDSYDGDALTVAKLVRELADFGLEARHLRVLRTAADREVGLIEQVVTPLLRQRGLDSRARAEEMTRELAALTVRLHATLVRAALQR